MMDCPMNPRPRVTLACAALTVAGGIYWWFSDESLPVLFMAMITIWTTRGK